MIEIGGKVTICEKTKGRPADLYASLVGDVLSDHQFLVTLPIVRGETIRLPLNHAYVFVFFTPDGLYRAEGRTMQYCTQNNITLVKIEISEFEHVQRRNFYRVGVVLPFIYTLLTCPDADMSGSARVYEGTVRNLSGNGIRFSTDKMLTGGDRILCRFSFDGAPVSAEGEILSTDRQTDGKQGKDAYINRLKFVDLDDRMQDKIVGYVFNVERGAKTKNRREKTPE